MTVDPSDLVKLAQFYEWLARKAGVPTKSLVEAADRHDRAGHGDCWLAMMEPYMRDFIAYERARQDLLLEQSKDADEALRILSDES